MNQFKNYSNDVQTAMRGISWESVDKALNILQRAKSQNSVVYTLGNGGSASTAAHFSNDLLKMGKLRSVCLSDMLPTMSAYANDEGWEKMYASMLKNLLLPMDVVFGISCSGFSSNIINAIKLAQEINLPSVRCVVLTGNTWDSPLTKLAPDVVIHVPFGDIRVQEDCHLVVCHALAGGL